MTAKITANFAGCHITYLQATWSQCAVQCKLPATLVCSQETATEIMQNFTNNNAW